MNQNFKSRLIKILQRHVPLKSIWFLSKMAAINTAESDAINNKSFDIEESPMQR